MWRPKNWNKNLLFILKSKPQEAYEAGADAMLQAMIGWIQEQEKMEMLDDPENFEYFCVKVSDLEQLEK